MMKALLLLLAIVAYREDGDLVIEMPPADYENVEITTEPPALFVQEGNTWRGSTPATHGTFEATVCDKVDGTCEFIEETFSTGTSLHYALLLAAGAGFLMNFMPCVLPAVGLKLMAFVKGSEKGSYVLGVMASFAILATLAVVLGTGLSHMSSWHFRVVLCAVCIAMGTHLLHLWTMPAISLGSLGGKGGAFGTGVLTVALGSSCTVPFLAPVLVYTASCEPWEVYALFMAMGIGFCSPFLIPIKGLLPKPGPWLQWFEKVCGLALAAVGVWLATTLSFSPADVQEYPTSGPRAIIVTAEWCVNCHVVYPSWHDHRVTQEIVDQGIIPTVLDWTDGQKEVTALLEKHGVVAVPFALIENEQGEVTILTGIYDADDILEALQ